MTSESRSSSNKKEMSSFLDSLISTSDAKTEDDLNRTHMKIEALNAEAEEILETEINEEVETETIQVSIEEPSVVENDSVDPPSAEETVVEESTPVVESPVSIEDEFKKLLEENENKRKARESGAKSYSATKEENRAEKKLKKLDEKKEKMIQDGILKSARLVQGEFDSSVINIEKLSTMEFEQLPFYTIHKKLFKQLPPAYIQELQTRMAGKTEEEMMVYFQDEMKSLDKDKKRRRRSLIAAALDEKIMKLLYKGDHGNFKISNMNFNISSSMAIILAVVGVLVVLNASTFLGLVLAATLSGVGFFSYRRYRKLINILKNK